MSPATQATQTFVAVVAMGPKRRAFVPPQFVPDDVWRAKADHHAAGTIKSMPVRAVVESLGTGFGIVIGPTWRRDFEVANEVTVMLATEGRSATIWPTTSAPRCSASRTWQSSSKASLSPTATRICDGSTRRNGGRTSGRRGSPKSLLCSPPASSRDRDVPSVVTARDRAATKATVADPPRSARVWFAAGSA